MAKKKAKKIVAPVKLPKEIRDELRMSCALKAYSHIKCGKGKTVPMQQSAMAIFYHGHPPHHPSQINLLASASYSYRGLYEAETTIATKKSDSIDTVIQYVLKSSVNLGYSHRFRSGVDITSLDLEKKLRSGNLLITGRQLFDMAKKGVKNYKKALSFCVKKWDLKTNSPIESGTTIDDVVEYVRRKMYIHLVKKNITGDDSEIEDEGEEYDKENEGEEEIEKDTHESTEVEINTVSNLKSTDTTTPLQNIDGSKSPDSNEDQDSDSDDIPDKWVFPSYFAFIAWGPFVDISERLALLLTDELHKSKENSSRQHLRKNVKNAKDKKSAHDSSAVRGFSTDQRIDIETLNVQKQLVVDRHEETSIVAMSIEESCIGRALVSAENRATMRCKEYDSQNEYWIRVDQLLDDQKDVISRIKNFNKKFVNTTTEQPEVSDFLNSASPDKSFAKRLNSEINLASSSADEISDTSSIALERSPKKRKVSNKSK